MPLAAAAALVCAFLLGLVTSVMDYDAAQYAAIAMEMQQHGQWLTVLERGQNYLDKPPLVFWSAAAAFQVFGLRDWAYKLPSLLALVVALVSVRGLASTLYADLRVARTAPWILASCVGAFLMISDVRTDTLLMGAVAFATWQWARWLRSGTTISLVLGSIGMGIGLLAKGPIGVVAPAFALLGDVWAYKRWRQLLDARLLIAVPVIAIVLSPMLIGLARQFGDEGLRFFFWTQSFGRVTGSSTWKNETSPLFFTHTFLWTFAPWSVFAIVGWVDSARACWRDRGRRAPDLTSGTQGNDWRSDALAIVGFTLVVLAISLSRYKLPHYIYVVFPWAALLASRAMWTRGEAIGGTWLTGHLILVVVVIALAAALAWWAFPLPGLLLTAAAMGSIVVAARAAHDVRFEAPMRITLGVSAGMAAAMILLLGRVFPGALLYQTETTVGRALAAAGATPQTAAAYRHHRPSLDFSAGFVVPDFADTNGVRSALRQSPTSSLLLYVRAADAAEVSRIAARADTVGRYDAFGVSRANARFLNPGTRATVTEPWLLLRLSAR